MLSVTPSLVRNLKSPSKKTQILVYPLWLDALKHESETWAESSIGWEVILSLTKKRWCWTIFLKKATSKSLSLSKVTLDSSGSLETKFSTWVCTVSNIASKIAPSTCSKLRRTTISSTVLSSFLMIVFSLERAVGYWVRIILKKWLVSWAEAMW